MRPTPASSESSVPSRPCRHHTRRTSPATIRMTTTAVGMTPSAPGARRAVSTLSVLFTQREGST
jgi:hypothetical protein